MVNYYQLLDLVKRNRSFRRFNENVVLSEETILRWLELARNTASGRNMQPLKYIIHTDRQINAMIFDHLAWAGYLTHWAGPCPGERPSAYVAVLKDKMLSENIYCDDGIALQTILLGAASEGFGGCIIGSFNKLKLSVIFKLPDHLELLWILALGKPAEEVVLEDSDGKDIRYWRDEQGVHHVPKRRLNELVFNADYSSAPE
jgi:nitroreductase